jgi:menaquinone-dependent protoporphyrinogen oxidase
MARVLVLFGTTDGHTAKIAAAIESTLRAQHGTDVQVTQPRGAAPDPKDYDAVIVAGSVHGGKFQKSITRWVQSHAATLNAKPTAFVGVCLAVLQREPKVQAEVQAIVARFFTGTSWHPTRSITVAGAVPYTRYNWLKRWMMKRIVAKAGGDTDTARDYEYTNWDELRAFSQEFGRRVSNESRTPIRMPA